MISRNCALITQNIHDHSRCWRVSTPWYLLVDKRYNEWREPKSNKFSEWVYCVVTENNSNLLQAYFQILRNASYLTCSELYLELWRQMAQFLQLSLLACQWFRGSTFPNIPVSCSVKQFSWSLLRLAFEKSCIFSENEWRETLATESINNTRGATPQRGVRTLILSWAFGACACSSARLLSVFLSISSRFPDLSLWDRACSYFPYLDSLKAEVQTVLQSRLIREVPPIGQW